MSLGKRLIGSSGATSGPGTEEVVDIFEDNSCKALYTFNYDASDLGGNYSLTEYNSSNNVWGAGGKFNTGYRIKDNSNGYLGITSHGFNYPNTAVSFWFYADKAYGEAYSTARTIFTFQNGTSTRKAYIGVSYNSSEGNWYGFINARSGLYGSTSTTVAFSGVIGGSELDNTWVHIVGQTGSDLVESRRNSFYVNGSLWTGMTYSTGSSTSSGGFHSPVPYRFYVGYYYSGNIQYAPAYPIDQLRIFNKKVTAAEASTLYNESVGTVQSTTDVVYFPTSALDTNLETQEVARYLLNDDVTDDLGNYNGTATSITYTNGKYGKSAVFNGSSSKITTGYTDNPSAFSVSGWIKHTSSTFTGKYHYLAGKGYYTNSSTNNYWQLVNYSSSYPEFRVRSGGTSVAATSSVAMTLNYWHHLVGTCDSAGNLKIYLDGALVGSASGAPSRSMGQGMIIGSYLDGTTYFHEGEIDQVRVFDYALGQEAVNSLYNDSDTPVIIDKAPETAFYKLNGNAYDSAGGFDGTASNITYTNGLFGQAAVFNGTNAQIETTATLIPNSTDFSLSFWVKPENQFGSILARGLVTTASYAYGFDVSFNNSANKLRFFRHTGGAYANEHYAETATNSITVGVWQHIALSFDKSTGTPQFYIDGSAVTTNIVTYAGGTGSAMATGNIAFNSSYDGGLYRLGNRSNGGLSTSRLKGTLDQVRIFDQTISSNQVFDLYNEASSAFSLSTLQAYYKLDNSAIDEASGFNGTEANIEYRFGRYGQAAVFNGSDGVITLPGDMLNSLTAISISVWVYRRTGSLGNYEYIMSGGTLASGKTYGIAIRDDGGSADNKFYVYDGSSSYNSNTICNYNQWYNVAITWAGTQLNFYINGILDSTHTVGNCSFASSGNTNKIGEYYYNGNFRFSGLIDQIRIFSSALSSSQVTELYNEKPEVDTSNFKTVLYEGTGATQYISNVGMDLETNGGLLWIKNRDAAYNNVLYDHVRNSFLYSNLANSQDTNTAISFEKNGFITSSTASAQNANNNSYVAWNWKSGGDAVAGTGTGVTNVSISTNTEAGFSIVKYTGGNSASDTVNHGLTDAEMIILKDLDDGSNNWRVWHKDLTTNYWLYLNLTNAQASAATDGGIRNVDSNNFGFINGTTAGVEGVNSSASNYIAYVWKSIAGYSSIGSYEGNGTTATTTITTGFKPSWVMIKRIDSANSWRIFDTRRDTTPLNLILDADTNNAESNGGTTTSINITSTGFNMNTSQFGGSINTDGGQYLYMAFK